MSHYPLFLDVAGRRCVVLGGGPFTLDKVRGLLEAGAAVTVITPFPVEGLAEPAMAGRIAVEYRAYRPGDLHGARLVIDASDDDAVHRAAATEAHDAGVFINVVDQPRYCDFIAPAVVRRNPLLIAVSTGGTSPYVASVVRSRIERLIGAEWGPFTALAGQLRRRLRARGDPVAEQLAVFRRLLASDVRKHLERGDVPSADFEVAAIEASRGRVPTGRVTLVGAGPGDPSLLTRAAVDALASADHVFHDALVHPGTLALCPPDATLIDVGKRGGRPSPLQDRITVRMIEAASAGHDVIRLKGGDPLLFARGGEELAALRAAGIETRVIPGVSSALAAPAVAGIPVTLRGVSSSLAVITGHDREGAAPARLEAVAAAVDTLIVLMPLGNLEAIAARVGGVVGAHRPAAVVESATLHDQRVVRAPISSIARAVRDGCLRSPATLIIGDVAAALPAADVTALAGTG